MKRILLALAILAFVLPAGRPAEAADVSIDFFYNNLSTGGAWVEVADYGYAWQPSIAVSNRDWRPYTDGYWAYTDYGWTWVSYEDFGWATYHYGRWARVRGRGWVWIPGREWAPAWVSWRTGGDHIGWAPLPPRRGYDVNGEVVYEGRPISGYVDIDFDIGPSYYNFVDIRYIGEPVLRSRILPVAQNVTYVTNTVNVTNITYENSNVYNYGPDFDRVSAYSTRPIQRLNLQRQTDVDFANVKADQMTKVQGNTLMVAGPQQFKAAEKSAAPKEVKTKIDRDQLETGWADVSDEKAKNEMQTKMKKEDRKSIPPPKIAPQNPAALEAGATGASPASAASPAPAAGASPEEQNGRGKDKDGREKDKHGREKGRDKQEATPAPSVAPGAAATPAPEAPTKLDGKKERGDRQIAPAPAATPDTKVDDKMTDKIKPGRKDRHEMDAEKAAPKPQLSTTEPVTTDAPPSTQQDASRGKKKKEDRVPDAKKNNRQEGPLPPERIDAPQVDPSQGAERRERPNRKSERISVPQPPERINAPQVEPSQGAEMRERPNRKSERMNIPQPPQRQAPEMAPPQRPQPEARPERQAPPPQMAPPRGQDQPQRGGNDGRDKGAKKNKKGDEDAPPPEE